MRPQSQLFYVLVQVNFRFDMEDIVNYQRYLIKYKTKAISKERTSNSNRAWMEQFTANWTIAKHMQVCYYQRFIFLCFWNKGVPSLRLRSGSQIQSSYPPRPSDVVLKYCTTTTERSASAPCASDTDANPLQRLHFNQGGHSLLSPIHVRVMFSVNPFRNLDQKPNTDKGQGQIKQFDVPYLQRCSVSQTY